MIGEADFEQAYPQTSRKIISSLIHRGANFTLAEDLAQEAWLNAWRFRDSFRGDCPFEKWVFAIGMGELRNFRRRPADVSLPDFVDPSYRQDFDAPIHAEQVLRRCHPEAASLLRRRYLQDAFDGPLSNYERVKLKRARDEASK